MKYLLLVLLIIPTCVKAQWRPIVSSGTASIEENFRRASVWSNRKLDRFGNDTVYGTPTFNSGFKLGDGGVVTSTKTYAILSATQTFTGINTFISSAAFSSNVSTITFNGWIDIGIEIVTNTSATDTCDVNCTTGKRVVGGGCESNNIVYNFYPLDNDTWRCKNGEASTTTCYAICARIK